MAAGPYSVPDEFINGLFKSAATLWQAMAGVPLQGNGPDKAQPGAAPVAPAAPLPVVSAESMQRLAQLQAQYLQKQAALWVSMVSPAAAQGSGAGTTAAATAAATPSGNATAPATAPAPTARPDARFRHPGWTNNPFLNLLRQSYLNNSQFLSDVVEAMDVDERERRRLRFFSRQFIDATSPGNSPLTNPDVWKHMTETGGATLMKGMENFLSDLAQGKVSITDEKAFEVGRNVATSEGAVVFQNDLIQLIQYAPLTPRVASRPLLIIPPCINKFYILDLQPANSFVRHAVGQGHTVFVVSWQNAPEKLHNLGWDDYIEQGAIRAIEVAREIASADKVNVVGWCVGGTIAASALAVMSARGDDHVSSMTLLTTLLDFEDAGDLGVLVDEDSVRQREQTLGNGGVYPGQELAFVFQTLRANDLLWPYVISNYMMGQSPDAFDLLYWNADSTNLAGPMYSWYLRNLYLENNLVKPGRLQMVGQSVDLGRITVPSFVMATREDHIVPWRTAFRSVGLLGGESQFVLGSSGHIAGVIAPPGGKKRGHWSGGELGGSADHWLQTAAHSPGSWWTVWAQWLGQFGGEEVQAPEQPGSTAHRAIEPAPGSYVKVRAVLS